MKKHWIKISLGVIVLVLVALLIVPFFVNANTFRPTLEAQLSQGLGRPVTLGNLSFSLLSGSLVADNISISDDAAFSSQPFLQAKSLHIGIETLPLIFHRQLIVTNFAADSPFINLIHSANGAWNFSSLGRTAASRTQNQQQESAFPNLTVGEIKIQNGSATVSSQPESGRPLVYSSLNLSIQRFSFSKSFPFQLSATLPGNGSLDLDGSAGPVNQRDASDTPLNAKIKLKHFDPVAVGVIEPNQGVAIVADIDAQLTSDGQMLTSDGKVHADHLSLVRGGAATPNPVDISYTTRYNLNARTGEIGALKLSTGGVAVQIKGAYQMTGPQAKLALDLSAPNLPLNQVQALLPVAGISLPSSSSLQGGTLTANLAINGPVNALTISGPIEVSNTRLAGFDLGSKIDGLRHAGSSQGGTQIQSLRANVTSSPAGTRIDNLHTVIPAIGSATGGGTLSPGGALNFNFVAKLNTSSGGLSAANGVLGKVISTAAAQGIPITITGTTANPVIRADLSTALRQNAGSILQQQLGKNSKQSNPANLLNKYFPH